MDAWRAMVRAQGGEPDAPLPTAHETEVVRADTDGYVESVDAYAIGVAAWRLGAGRARKEDPVSAAAGVVLHKRPGDPVRVGEPLYELRADDATRLPAAAAEAAVRCGVDRRAGDVAAGHRADRLSRTTGDRSTDGVGRHGAGRDGTLSSLVRGTERRYRRVSRQGIRSCW